MNHAALASLRDRAPTRASVGAAESFWTPTTIGLGAAGAVAACYLGYQALKPHEEQAEESSKFEGVGRARSISSLKGTPMAWSLGDKEEATSVSTRSFYPGDERRSKWIRAGKFFVSAQDHKFTYADPGETVEMAIFPAVNPKSYNAEKGWKTLNFRHPSSLGLPERFQRYWGNDDVGAHVPVSEANSLIRRLRAM